MPYDATLLKQLIASARGLSTDKRNRLNLLPEPSVERFARVWDVTDVAQYRELVHTWTNQVGWCTRSTNAMLLALAADPNAEPDDLRALTANWTLIVGASLDDKVREQDTVNSVPGFRSTV